MHVIGARFANLESAHAALGEIRASVGIPPGDVAVRPLGSTRYEEPTVDFLLAGRFPEREVDRVTAIVEEHSGMLLSRRVEWPHPSLARVTVGGGVISGRGPGRDTRARPQHRQRFQIARFGAAAGAQQGGHVRLRRRPRSCTSGRRGLAGSASDGQYVTEAKVE